ncbi:MAG: nucleoid occlusion factor SlmA [Gammaproteobacteria bacterium RIFCSPLOWO2_02_FULL_61_13]|nr:MAG: nucleoid occlusion factor SlmA [Gammaproteobacteria bacterium RIFCSPLOWO2_02_FULL_61_13]
MSARARVDRKQQILEVLARELETHPGSRITTAGLAQAVGVSEAALYRHFASKARMFEALIDFAEDSVFSLVNRILEQDQDAVTRCERITRVLLGFSDRNPGITRILLGDALVGENERLRARVGRFFERVETQLKQVLREANLVDGLRAAASIDASANQIMALIEGRICQYVRSDFRRRPTEFLDEQWVMLRAGLFH